MSFWNNLNKTLPTGRQAFFAMAPMSDVTDSAFRKLVAKCGGPASPETSSRGGPDVFFTEFVSADGLYHTREIQKIPDAENPLMRILSSSEAEHPIIAPQEYFHFPKPEYGQGKLVAQIFSSKPEMVSYAVKVISELGFDGVDINMGCPDRAIEKQGAGAALMKNPLLAVELIRAAKEASNLPVSVKTRVGYHKESLDEWLTILLKENLAAITLHLRTRKELSLAKADWELMKKAVEIRNKINPNVLLIGNGDVESVEEGERFANETGCDGIMIGRAVFGNPWIFAGRKPEDTPLAEKLAALIELAHNFEKISPPKSFSILKKHIKAFVTGFSGASELRAKLMIAESADDLERILRENPL